MNIDLMKKMAAYVKNADGVIQTLQKQASDRAAADARVKELAPRVADLYVKNNYVPEALREKTAAALGNHLHALELIQELVSQPAPPPSMGKSADARLEKTAAYGEQLTKAERQLLERLNII